MMRLIAVVCTLFACLLPALAADKKAEEIIAQHLESIGTAEARAAVKSRAVKGTLRFKILAGGTGDTPGKWALVSDQGKSNFVIRFGDSHWSGERFVLNGDKTSFAAFTPSHLPSEVAVFVQSHDVVIKQGLLGGALSTDWALLNLDHSRVKLDSIGRKNIDGHELEGLEYLSKSNGEMTIKLYFDPETHRHVMTVYSVSRAAAIAHNDIANARQQSTRYTIEERFSDFQTENGITLPRHYDLQYGRQLQTGSVCLYDWDMTAEKVLNNPDIDPENFQLK
jgi:hypothetical protein